MDKKALVSMVVKAGLVSGAEEDLMDRAEQRFPGDEAPSAADIASFLKSTREDKPHWWTAAPVQRQASPIAPEHAGLSAAERLTRYRPATPAKSRRPEPFTASAEQAASLAKLTPTARLTALRQMQRVATDV